MHFADKLLFGVGIFGQVYDSVGTITDCTIGDYIPVFDKLERASDLYLPRSCILTHV